MTGPSYPLRLDANPAPTPSRWLWIFKFFLLIPHFIVLAFLWIAYVVVSAIAFFAILFTARYPRALFDFNVGVLRWTWRVGYYGYAVNGTDIYPPFTLRDVPDYPTHVEVAYPERLSRGLVLVKWWLLAIPHWIVVGVFAGGGIWLADRAVDTDVPVASGGLISIMVLVAAIVLLLTGTYPQPIYEFVMGMNRWVLRVAAYVGLMTDVYPPFRMDMGGPDASTLAAIPPPPAPPVAPGIAPEAPPMPAAPSAPSASSAVGNWTGGRITSLVIGSILALLSFGLLTGGAATWWADGTQRDAAGYVSTGDRNYATTGAALTTSPIDLGPPGAARIVQTVLGDVRVTAASADGGELFLGIGPTQAVDDYLAGVGRGVIEDGYSSQVVERSGGPASPPGEQTFWVASESGAGAQTIDWRIAEGDWTVVAMEPDGSQGVSATMSAGATVPALGWITFGLLATGAFLLTIGVLLIVLAIPRSRSPAT